MGIEQLLNQTIAVKNPRTTRDKSGNQSLGSSVSMRARAQRTNKIIATATSDREPIDLIVFVTDSVEIGAQVTYDSQQYRVMAVNDRVGYGGTTHHLELMCQHWSYAS